MKKLLEVDMVCCAHDPGHGFLRREHRGESRRKGDMWSDKWDSTPAPLLCIDGSATELRLIALCVSGRRGAAALEIESQEVV